MSKKPICMLIVEEGCGGKNWFEGVVTLKRFVSDGGGFGNWSGSKFGGKNGGGGGGGRLLLLLLLVPSGLNISSSLSLFSLDINSKSIMSGAPFKIYLDLFS